MYTLAYNLGGLNVAEHQLFEAFPLIKDPALSIVSRVQEYWKIQGPQYASRLGDSKNYLHEWIPKPENNLHFSHLIHSYYEKICKYVEEQEIEEKELEHFAEFIHDNVIEVQKKKKKKKNINS